MAIDRQQGFGRQQPHKREVSSVDSGYVIGAEPVIGEPVIGEPSFVPQALEASNSNVSYISKHKRTILVGVGASVAAVIGGVAIATSGDGGSDGGANVTFVPAAGETATTVAAAQASPTEAQTSAATTPGAPDTGSTGKGAGNETVTVRTPEATATWTMTPVRPTSTPVPPTATPTREATPTPKTEIPAPTAPEQLKQTLTQGLANAKGTEGDIINARNSLNNGLEQLAEQNATKDPQKIKLPVTGLGSAANRIAALACANPDNAQLAQTWRGVIKVMDKYITENAEALTAPTVKGYKDFYFKVPAGCGNPSMVLPQ